MSTEMNCIPFVIADQAIISMIDLDTLSQTEPRTDINNGTNAQIICNIVDFSTSVWKAALYILVVEHTYSLIVELLRCKMLCGDIISCQN